MCGIGPLKNLATFSVKSAYRHLQLSKEEGTNHVEFWKKMWKISVPPKVKDLLWRAASNCLPTKTQLLSRHVSVDAICPLCQTQKEIISHCLVECTFVRSCWNRLNDKVNTEVTGSFVTW